MTAPIALFVYNRPSHTRQTVEALRDNLLSDSSDLFIFSDAPKSEAASDGVAEVRRYLQKIDGFKSVTIIERETNWGVDPSVIDGVTMLCDRFGQVVVLEDDLVTSPWFLTYANQALDRYRDDERVMQVSGFMFPVEGFDEREACFIPYSTCWGWATWERAWNKFDAGAEGYAQLKGDLRKQRAFNLDGAYDYFHQVERYVEGKTDAWDIRWYLSVFLHNGLSLFPAKSLVNNIGFDGSGVHCIASDLIINELAKSEITGFPAVVLNVRFWKAVEKYLKSRKERSLKSTVKRILRYGR
ncbi:MAG: glycosyltransferase family 2 protein [Burkholderiaceae bacterium]